MKTVQTKPDCTLGFVEETLVKTNGDLLTYLWEKVSFLHSYKLLGKLSEITEEQAEELVDSKMKYPGCMHYRMYYEFLGNDFNLIRAIYSLRSAALSVGIPETDFDKYLVIKL
jgi:hypothetical protein